MFLRLQLEHSKAATRNSDWEGVCPEDLGDPGPSYVWFLGQRVHQDHRVGCPCERAGCFISPDKHPGQGRNQENVRESCKWRSQVILSRQHSASVLRDAGLQKSDVETAVPLSLEVLETER